jgi:hypothetical protein
MHTDVLVQVIASRKTFRAVRAYERYKYVAGKKERKKKEKVWKGRKNR